MFDGWRRDRSCALSTLGRTVENTEEDLTGFVDMYLWMWGVRLGGGKRSVSLKAEIMTCEVCASH